MSEQRPDNDSKPEPFLPDTWEHTKDTFTTGERQGERTVVPGEDGGALTGAGTGENERPLTPSPSDPFRAMERDAAAVIRDVLTSEASPQTSFARLKAAEMTLDRSRGRPVQPIRVQSGPSWNRVRPEHTDRMRRFVADWEWFMAEYPPNMGDDSPGTVPRRRSGG